MINEFDVVIGLEIHAQLKSQSKCFSSASTQFGAPPNSQVTLLCAGMPGSLPVLNKQAVALAIKTGLVLNCDIQEKSVFSRKQYFYPDMPKGYQITQYEKPIALNGYVDFYLEGEKKRVHLERAHMEEDAGKSTHHGEHSLINLNRAGIPLLEIVTKPEIKSPKEAAAYARAVRQNLVYADVCRGNLEEGSLRCDCNVSLKPKGQKKLGTKVELKNINSFRFIEKALEYEINRQYQLLSTGQSISQETRLYDSTKNKTFSMRKKEEANDYRYFPEPDLPPLVISKQWMDQLQSELPQTPIEKYEKYTEVMGLSHQDAEILTGERPFSQFFEKVIESIEDEKLVANWLTGEFLKLFNSHNSSWEDLPLSPTTFADLLKKLKAKSLSANMAKEVLEILWTSSKSVDQIIKEKGFVQLTDDGAIQALVDKVVENNPKQLSDYKAGKDKLFGFFVGQVMKESKGQASPEVVNRLLKEKLK